MAEIEKALRPKVRTNPIDKLPSQYTEYLDLFNHQDAKKLPPLRGASVDHDIELVPNQDGSEPEVPNRPLYNMSKEQLLVLRKTLNELLDQGFIRVSNSPAGAPLRV